MKIKIYKRTYLEIYDIYMPYMIINTENISEKEYAEMHKNSIYKDYKYEIIK